MSREPPGEGRPAGQWLAQNTYLVAGALALFCVVAVGLIALYDQLLGTERWCYQWLTAQGDLQTICRDSERSCHFHRDQRCTELPRGAASDCRPRDEVPTAPSRCRR